jgi:penicillin-insensitive murein endopeptidase
VVPSLWSPQISQLIKLAAEDSDVTRIFVNPAIKQQLCLDAGSDASGCAKSVPGSSIARICTSVCAARRAAWSAKIRRHRRPAMAAERSCRAGSNHLNPGLPPVKKTPPPLPPSCQALLDEHVL